MMTRRVNSSSNNESQILWITSVGYLKVNAPPKSQSDASPRHRSMDYDSANHPYFLPSFHVHNSRHHQTVLFIFLSKKICSRLSSRNSRGMCHCLQRKLTGARQCWNILGNFIWQNNYMFVFIISWQDGICQCCLQAAVFMQLPLKHCTYLLTVVSSFWKKWEQNWFLAMSLAVKNNGMILSTLLHSIA